MKKIIMTALMAVSMLSAFADTDNEMSREELAAAYDMTVNYRSLDKALELSPDQAEYVHMAYDLFQKQMVCAGTCSLKNAREAMTLNAVRSHTRILRPVLDQAQYRKYLSLLNATLRNRNIEVRNSDGNE